MTRFSDRRGLVAALLAVCACGGGERTASLNAPTPPSPPTPPAPARWSVAGQLVDTVARQPVAGAQVAPSWELTPATTDEMGRFEMGSTVNPPTAPYKLVVSGPNLITRELWVGWERGARTDVMLDVIRDRPPFSMQFYRQFVRGTYDNDTVYALFRWMQSPSFYIRTVDQNGRAIEPEVLAVMREAIHRAVAEFTDGRLTVAALESGTEARPSQAGWINIDILRDRNERTRCGFAAIGANPGNITFYNDLCSCGSNKIPGALVLHEVGHALGFFHVPDTNSVMYPFLPGNCPRGELSPAEKYHARIAYSRPRGNLDPDIDPSTARAFVEAPVLVTDR